MVLTHLLAYCQLDFDFTFVSMVVVVYSLYVAECKFVVILFRSLMMSRNSFIRILITV